MHSMIIRIIAITLGALTSISAAQAGNESWVSGTGNDTGTCPITAPCRTFAYAHDQTVANGTINVLSSGSFGPLTITKRISIVAQGVEALIDAGANNAAIVIQAPENVVVSLRGLTIDLRGTSNRGIDFRSGAALHVHDSVIRGAGLDAILFAPSAGQSELYVADSAIARSQNGIQVRPTASAGALVVLDRVRVENVSASGILFDSETTIGTINGTVRDSLSAGSNRGISVSEGGSGITRIVVERSAAVNNTFGLLVFGTGATVRIGDSNVSGNGTGLSAVSGGAIASYQTNKIDGNGTDGSPTSTITMK